jgi:uncharacterized PurR-regulated membrane protein YhhQ (DUF165 family)
MAACDRINRCSQLVDNYIVLFIAFAGKFSWQQIRPGMVNYTYKFIMAIVLTPLIYLMERRIENISVMN